MAVLGPGSDRPAAVRPGATRRTALDGFFDIPRGMPPLRGRGKKQAEPLREGDRGLSRPSGLIRPFEVAWDAPIKQTDGDHHDDRHRTRTGNAGRRKMCVRAPTEMQKRDPGNDGAWIHIAATIRTRGQGSAEIGSPSRCQQMFSKPAKIHPRWFGEGAVSRRQYRGHARSMIRSDLPPIRTDFTSAGHNALFPLHRCFADSVLLS